MKLFIRKLLIFILPLLSFVMISSCDDDEETSSYTKPLIGEVSPAEGLIGTSVTITGNNLKNVTGVKFGSVNASSFQSSSNTETSITVTVPEGLEAGETAITVFYAAAAENNIGPSADIPFTVLFAPVLSEVTPVEAKPGFEIVVAGNYLESASTVTLGDLPASFDATATSLTITVPDDAAPGEVQLAVNTPGGTAQIPFTVLAKTPEIYSLAPLEAKTGEEVTITGLFFSDIQSIMVGSTEVEAYTVVSPAEIKFNIPEGATSNKVKVTTALGEVESAETLNVVVIISVPYVIYADDLNADWQKWGGWGTSAQEVTNTEHPNTGTHAIKIDYTSNSWGGVQLHPVNPDPLLLEPVTKLKLSVYGAPGSAGKKIAVYIKDKSGADPPADAIKELTITEGAYATYEILLSELGNPANVNELLIKNNNADAITIFVDDIEFH